jgi:hypothetical protein
MRWRTDKSAGCYVMHLMRGVDVGVARSTKEVSNESSELSTWRAVLEVNE